MKTLKILPLLLLLITGTGFSDTLGSAGRSDLNVEANGPVEYTLPAGERLLPLTFSFLITNPFSAGIYLLRIEFHNNGSLALENLSVDLNKSTCKIGIDHDPIPIPAGGHCILTFIAPVPVIKGDYTHWTANIIDAIGGANYTSSFGVNAT